MVKILIINTNFSNSFHIIFNSLIYYTGFAVTTMQLSEDGNYQWNGEEWIPVEQSPAITETAPVEVPETTPVEVPETAPVEVPETAPADVQTPAPEEVQTPAPMVVSTPAVTPILNFAKFTSHSFGSWI